MQLKIQSGLTGLTQHTIHKKHPWRVTSPTENHRTATHIPHSQDPSSGNVLNDFLFSSPNCTFPITPRALLWISHAREPVQTFSSYPSQSPCMETITHCSLLANMGSALDPICVLSFVFSLYFMDMKPLSTFPLIPSRFFSHSSFECSSLFFYRKS